MNRVFDGSVANKLGKYPETSVTVFKKKTADEGWEKALDPFYCPDTQNLPKMETWRENLTISLALNHPISDDITCKVLKIENGSHKDPNKIGNFKWEIEMTSTKDSPGGPITSIEIEVSDGSEIKKDSEESESTESTEASESSESSEGSEKEKK